MFGYVKAAKQELRIREYDTYCAAYCGLCRAMGKCTGQLSRLTLSYDFVFLALTRSVLQKEKLSYTHRRCIVHPIKKRPMLDITPALEYSARASVCLASYKAEDDRHDEKRGKKLISELVFPFFKHLKTKVVSPELEDKIKQRLDALSKLEDERCPSLDATAEQFGELLGEVFCCGLDGDARKIAYEIGFHSGKFIYAADAADDYEKDLRDASYNPLVCLYGDSFGQEERDSVKTALLCELTQLERAVALLDFSEYRDIGEIISNIIYIGMPEQMDRALFKKVKNEE